MSVSDELRLLEVVEREQSGRRNTLALETCLPEKHGSGTE